MAEVIHDNAGGNQLNAVADKTQVYGLSGNDTLISANKKDALLIGGSGNDSLVMMGGNGDDTINNRSDSVTILGGAGNDSIKNGIARIGQHIDDTLTFVDSISGGDSVSIAGGADNDTLYNGGSYVTINGGAGNDRISLLSGAKNNVIEYKAGDGFDTVWGYDNTTTLKIGDGTGSYSQTVSGDDLIINVGNGSITLKDAREKPAPIILGESKSDGGGSNSGGDNGGHSSGGNGGNGDNTKGNISAGGNINTGGSINTNDNSNRDGYSGGNDNASATTYSSPFDTLKTTAATNLNFYAGGNQIIADYQSGQKIMLGTLPTGYIFGGDNFALTSTTGTLLIRDAKDKIIAFTDGAGNDFLKAYSATNAGLIDGRGLTGFEVISGSDAGSDLIFAGDNGSSLWGGNGVHSDTLVGGGGMDIFVGGKTQGADTFLNASANDIVFLSDSTLEDVVATAGNDNAVAVAFNTGNVIMVGSSDTLSAAFMLADGSAYRYNHVAKTWQTA